MDAQGDIEIVVGDEGNRNDLFGTELQDIGANLPTQYQPRFVFFRICCYISS